MPRITEHGYGFFPGGDPRRFEPDSDSTPEEVENHRRACEAWDRGEQNSAPDCEHHPGVIITRCQFGLGSYSYEEDISWADWFRYVALSRIQTWIFWRLPLRVQDWLIARQQRALIASFRKEKR